MNLMDVLQTYILKWKSLDVLNSRNKYDGRKQLTKFGSPDWLFV